VEAREGNHVNSKLAKIRIELTREAKAGRDTAHGGRDEVIKIAISRSGELKSAEADIVECLVINAISFVGVLDKLVDRECGIVGLNDGIGDLGGGDDGESAHNTVRVLLANLGDEKSSHARASAATKRVSELESLKAITALSLLANNIQNGIDKLGSLGVMTLSPVISSSALSKDEVVGAEKLTKRSRANRIHSTGLKIDENCTRNVLSSSSFVIINIDTFQLKIGISMVSSRGIYAMLV